MRNQAADLVKEACQEMVENMSTKDNLSKEDFMNIKRTICAKYGLRLVDRHKFSRGISFVFFLLNSRFQSNWCC